MYAELRMHSYEVHFLSIAGVLTKRSVGHINPHFSLTVKPTGIILMCNPHVLLMLLCRQLPCMKKRGEASPAMKLTEEVTLRDGLKGDEELIRGVPPSISACLPISHIRVSQRKTETVVPHNFYILNLIFLETHFCKRKFYTRNLQLTFHDLDISCYYIPRKWLIHLVCLLSTPMFT